MPDHYPNIIAAGKTVYFVLFAEEVLGEFTSPSDARAFIRSSMAGGPGEYTLITTTEQNAWKYRKA